MANLRTREGRPRLFACEIEDTKTPEQRLWLSVLYQGVFEALTFSYNAIPLTDAERKTTRTWINLDNEDFKQVCENAGFSPLYVYNQIRKVVKKNELETKIQINPMVAKAILSRTESNA